MNSISWCKSKKNEMSLVVGMNDGAQIWKRSLSGNWEMSVSLLDSSCIIRNVAWANNIGKEYETVAVGGAVNPCVLYYVSGW